MPTYTWNPFAAKRKTNDEEQPDLEHSAFGSPEQPLPLSARPIFQPHYRSTNRKNTFVDSFHRDAFSSRLSPHFEALPGGDGMIRFGNKIALKQMRSGRFLHADKEHKLTDKEHKLADKESFAATLHSWKSHKDDYWIVLPQLGQTQLMGKPVHYNYNIRLQHVFTNSNLHTHQPKSTETIGWEVSLLPDARSDSNDVWAIEPFSLSATTPSGDDNGSNSSPALNSDKDSMESANFWHVDDIISLRHHATRCYLTGHPDQVADKDKRLGKVVATGLSGMGAAWRVVVPKGDEERMQGVAMMEENSLNSFTVEQIAITDSLVSAEPLY